MLATSLVIGSFITILFFIVGLMVGWIGREYMLNYQDRPSLHPEFFDQHGNVLPDEVVAVRFEEGYFDDEDEDEE